MLCDLLNAAFAQCLQGRSSLPAIFDAGGAVVRRFGEIAEEATEWEARFGRELPPGRGHVVALQIGNHPAWPALLLALARCGAIPLPLGGHLGAEEREAALCCGQASAWLGIEKGELALHLRPAGPPPSWPSPAPEFLKLTSGTTAAPRVIRFTFAALIEDARQIMETMQFGSDDLNYGVIPVSHSYGFSNLLTPLLCAGVPLVLSDDRMPRAILRGLATTGATVFPGMPVFFDKLAALPGALPPLPRLRLCLSAGAPLPPSVGEAFTGRFGLKIHSFYGSSECGGIAYDASPEPHYRDGYVGPALRRVSLSLGEEGRLEVRGPTLGLGYWPPEEGDPLPTGRFLPGDLVQIDAEGGVQITGRLSDAINIAGRKLNPGEVEASLRRCPGVRDVVVFGIPSPLRHEEAVACVAGEVEESALLAFARCHLSQWQIPKAFWIVPAIPVNERGKTDRRGLAARYQAVQG